MDAEVGAAVSTCYYDYTEADIKKYRAHVYMCACYTPETATSILVNRKCKLFGAGKIRAFIDEFMKERKEIEEKNLAVQTVQAEAPSTQHTSINLPADDHTRAIILLHIIKQLPGYARAGGGMMVCALAKYLTAEQWEEELDYLENSQDTRVIWVEQFIRAGMTIRDSAQVNSFIEAEAEKIPLCVGAQCGQYIELTFID